MNTPVIVIGVGNIYRRDDALGPTVVQLLRESDLPDVAYADSDGEPIGLIELWQDADLAVVVDAVRTQPVQPGRVHRLSGHHPAANSAVMSTSHAVDLGDTVALARALGRMPRNLLIFAVEVADTGFGVGLSPEVEQAAHKVATEIAGLLAAGAAPR